MFGSWSKGRQLCITRRTNPSLREACSGKTMCTHTPALTVEGHRDSQLHVTAGFTHGETARGFQWVHRERGKKGKHSSYLNLGPLRQHGQSRT